MLGPTDLPDFLALTGRDPVVNAFAEYRARSTNLETRLMSGEMWGRYDDGHLVAGCHVGANLVPVSAPDDLAAFAERALTRAALGGHDRRPPGRRVAAVGRGVRQLGSRS